MDETRAKRMTEELIGKYVGQWEIIEYLGSGKSALVFRGKCGEQERAVKIFDPELVERFGKENQLKRIHRELLLRDRGHEHLIHIIDGGECNTTGHLFLVMNCLNYPTLEDVIRDIPRPNIRRIISQIANAAQYLESLGLCHRDIKPSNIVITPNYENSTLLDLGVLRPIGNSDITDDNARNFIGTLRYSSPEFLMRRENDTIEGWRAVTFYQLGAILHDLIMKKPLFAEYTEPFACLVEAVNKVKPLIDADDVSPDLIHLANTCLIKNPQVRLELVRWESFSLDEQKLQNFEAVKERVCNRSVATQSNNSCSMEPIIEQQSRQYERTQKQILEKIEMVVRSICTGKGAFPPTKIKAESSELIVIFPPSSMHQLSSTLCLHLKIDVVDADSEAILLSYWSGLSNKNIESKQFQNEDFHHMFSGVYQNEIISDRIEKFLYMSFDKAQQLVAKLDFEIIPLGSFDGIGG